jgi:hypothetical protein
MVPVHPQFGGPDLCLPFQDPFRVLPPKATSQYRKALNYGGRMIMLADNCVAYHEPV